MLKYHVPQRLSGKSRFLHGIWRALCLAILPAGVLLAGCAAEGIEIRPVGQPGGPALARLVQRQHAIAVLGVDYDPPLDGTGWTAGSLEQGVTLLVAVANQGRVPAENVQVAVALLDPAAPPGAAELAAETQVIKALAPGQMAQVRFAAVSRLPKRARYILRVEARPLPGETEVTDNVRVYDIRLQLDP